jgi:serine/threonine protein kinase
LARGNDFRRIGELRSDVPSLSDCLVELSGVECVNGDKPGCPALYRRHCDGLEIVVRTIVVSESDDDRPIDYDIEQFMSLRHPCITSPFGFMLLEGSNELKIARLAFLISSLEDIVPTNPSWWTPTVKSMAISGIALGARFAHSFRIVYRALGPTNILFAVDHRIQIADFGTNRRPAMTTTFPVPEVVASGEWTMKSDVFMFTLIPFEVVVGQPLSIMRDGLSDLRECPTIATERIQLPKSVSPFVAGLIGSRISTNPDARPSFCQIVDALKDNSFGIVDEVNLAIPSAFVREIEFAEV